MEHMTKQQLDEWWEDYEARNEQVLNLIVRRQGAWLEPREFISFVYVEVIERLCDVYRVSKQSEWYLGSRELGMWVCDRVRALANNERRRASRRRTMVETYTGLQRFCVPDDYYVGQDIEIFEFFDSLQTDEGLLAAAEALSRTEGKVAPAAKRAGVTRHKMNRQRNTLRKRCRAYISHPRTWVTVYFHLSENPHIRNTTVLILAWYLTVATYDSLLSMASNGMVDIQTPALLKVTLLALGTFFAAARGIRLNYEGKLIDHAKRRITEDDICTADGSGRVHPLERTKPAVGARLLTGRLEMGAIIAVVGAACFAVASIYWVSVVGVIVGAVLAYRALSLNKKLGHLHRESYLSALEGVSK